jgi:hypothetical protein
MLVSFVVIAFLLHTPLSMTALKLMTCVRVASPDGGEAESRMELNRDYSCEDTGTILRIIAVVVPVLLFISVGIPLGSFLLLRSIGPSRLDQWRNLLGFLFSGYRRDVYYWESVSQVRKVCLAFVTTSLATVGGGLQVTAALLVLIVFLGIHGRASPYVEDTLNLIDGVSLVIAGVTLVGAVFIVLGSFPLQLAAAIVIIIVNLGFGIFAVTILSSYVRHRMRDLLVRISPAREVPAETADDWSDDGNDGAAIDGRPNEVDTVVTEAADPMGHDAEEMGADDSVAPDNGDGDEHRHVPAAAGGSHTLAAVGTGAGATAVKGSMEAHGIEVESA